MGIIDEEEAKVLLDLYIRENHGTRAAFAFAIGVSPAYVSKCFASKIPTFLLSFIGFERREIISAVED